MDNLISTQSSSRLLLHHIQIKSKPRKQRNINQTQKEDNNYTKAVKSVKLALVSTLNGQNSMEWMNLDMHLSRTPWRLSRKSFEAIEFRNQEIQAIEDRFFSNEGKLSLGRKMLQIMHDFLPSLALLPYLAFLPALAHPWHYKRRAIPSMKIIHSSLKSSIKKKKKKLSL